MAGKEVVQGAQPIEYMEEDSFATEDDGTGSWEWFGIVTSWSATQGLETENLTYLPEHGASNKLEKRMNVATSEMWEGDLTYNPQDFTLLQYFTGSDGGTADKPSTIRIGEVDENNGEYRQLLGAHGEEWEFSVEEDGVAECSASFTIADGNDWTTSDYIDSANGGAHAVEDTTEPFSYDDLGNVTLGGTAIDHAIEGLTFTVSNDLAVVKDPDAGRGSHIEALIPTTREVSVELTLTYSDMSMAQTVRNYNPQDLVFDVGDYTFTIEGVQFPEFPYEMSPEDLVGDSVSSDPCRSITWTSPA